VDQARLEFGQIVPLEEPLAVDVMVETAITMEAAAAAGITAVVADQHRQTQEEMAVEALRILEAYATHRVQTDQVAIRAGQPFSTIKEVLQLVETVILHKSADPDLLLLQLKHFQRLQLQIIRS
jgi:hypothetical protein